MSHSRRTCRHRIHVLTAVGACLAAAPLHAQVTPQSSTRRVATYHVLPPVWGGTEWSDVSTDLTFGLWNGLATEKAYAAQVSDLSTPTITGAFEFEAALTNTGAPIGTFESADSTLLSTFDVNQPSICTVSGSYSLHRYQTATAFVDVTFGPATRPLFSFHADTAVPVENYTVEGPVSGQFTLAAGRHVLNVAASGTANAVTSMVAGTGEGTLELSVRFEPDEAAIIDVPEDHPTIAAAIEAAVDFQMVRIAPGTYFEHLVLGGKRLVIASASETEPVVLDGQGRGGSLLTITGSQGAETLVRGLTFRNAGEGTRVPSIGAPAGGGVLVINARPRFLQCRFESNHAALGGGLAIQGGGATLTECVFTHNSALNGGAFRFAPDGFGDVLTLHGTTLTCNEATTPGSALAVSGSLVPTITIVDGTICNNSPTPIAGINIAIDPSTVLCGCPGDLDQDGVVDGADLSLLIGAWGTSSPAADIDCSGTVRSEDLAQLLGAWGVVGTCD
ncbi:MAG: hypothetical protein JNL80_10075 [Phycisphaerae bacterium]|nr:hypothetical protein [Phycisphaerae bacterium]